MYRGCHSPWTLARQAASHQQGHPHQQGDAKPEGALAAAGFVGQARQGWAQEAAQALQSLQAAQGGALTFILARRIGEAFTARAVDPAPLRDFLITEGALP